MTGFFLSPSVYQEGSFVIPTKKCKKSLQKYAEICLAALDS